VSWEHVPGFVSDQTAYGVPPAYEIQSVAT
jgi:hypothetical protein